MVSRYRTMTTVALIVAMIALSGCIGALDGSGTATPTDQTDSDGTEPGVTTQQTATPTQTPTPPTSDELNVTEARNETQASLEEAGSYTAIIYRFSQTLFQSQTQTLVSNTTLRTDSESNRTVASVEGEGSTISGNTSNFTAGTYIEGDTAYTRISNATGFDYSSVDYSGADIDPPQSPAPTSTENPLSLLSLFEGWEEQELTVLNGVRVQRFTATELTPQSSRPVLRSQQVTNWSAEFYIDSEGIIRSFEANYTTGYSNSNITSETDLSYTVSNIGSTTVHEPDWISEAPEPEPVATPTGPPSDSESVPNSTEQTDTESDE